MPQPHVFADYESLSRHVADWLAERVRQVPDALLCLAAGASPTRAYQLFADRVAAEPRLSDRLRIFKLDEWGGLERDDPATCEQFLRRNLLDRVPIGDRYVGFDAHADDPNAECRLIADWLAKHGPIDTCILGLGTNGHIGFNEPAESLQPHAHIARLSQASLRHAMLSNAPQQPTFGLTLGMADLMHAQNILLIVNGPTKRDPLRRLLDGPITTEFPATLLRLHSRLQLCCDKDALPAT